MATTISGAKITVTEADLTTPLADSDGGTGQTTAIPFKEGFTSAEQTITAAGALTIPHGLSASPSLIQLRLICKTTDLGYSVNDEIIMSMGSTDGGFSVGISVVPDSTNLNVRYGSYVSAATGVFFVNNKTTGNTATITMANWKLIVRAWA